MDIRLLIADHQIVMREGLKCLLAKTNVSIVGEAGTEREAVRLTKELKPDVVLLDVRFAGEDGFTLMHRLRKQSPELPILMWSTSENLTYVARAMALGANGYLTRALGKSEFLGAIRTAAEGKQAWSKQHLSQFKGAREVPPDLGVHITPREREVLRQLSYGLSNKELALALGISFETVKEHIQHILRKLNMTDRTQAAVWTIRKGLD